MTLDQMPAAITGVKGHAESGLLIFAGSQNLNNYTFENGAQATAFYNTIWTSLNKTYTFSKPFSNTSYNVKDCFLVGGKNAGGGLSTQAIFMNQETILEDPWWTTSGKTKRYIALSKKTTTNLTATAIVRAMNENKNVSATMSGFYFFAAWE